MSKLNEKRPGYKKTRVGWIPEEWECVNFVDVGKLIRGPFGGALKKEIFVTSGFKVYEQQHAIYGDFYAGEYFIDEENYERLKRFALQPGDIIMSCSGTAGRFAIFPPNANPGVINQALLKISPQRKIITIHFLYYFLNSQYFHRSLFADFAGGAIKNIAGMPIIKKISIPLPPLPEQKKIAEILSAWDRAIEQVGKLIDAKQQLKKGLMQQLLTGRMRFPEFGPTNKRVKAHFYDFSSDWKHPQISEIASEVSERDRELINYPVLSCSKYDGFVNSLEYFGKKVYSNDTSNYKLIKQGQFGFPSNHIEEGSIGLLHHIGAGIVSPIYTVFEVNLKKVFAPYLYALFKTDTYQHVFNVNTNSSVDRRGSLRWKEFSKIRVPLPSVEEQTRIASVLSTCDREIELLRKKQAALREQKKGLMQKLITGEIKVEV